MRVHAVHFDAGGSIGRHPAGPAQLFVVTSGTGWIEGGDGVRHALREGDAAYVAAGESHAKGATTAMSALMIQCAELTPQSAAPKKKEGGDAQ